MTLTTTDLNKIRGVVREEVEAEIGGVKTELNRSITMVDLRNSTVVREIKSYLKDLRIGITKIQKDLKYAVSFLDKQDIKTEGRLEKIEKKLNLQPLP